MRADVAGALYHDAAAARAARRRRGARRTARIACSTPTAVTGEGSPDPPRATSTPVTQGVTSAMASMSAVVAPTSSAAR